MYLLALSLGIAACSAVAAKLIKQHRLGLYALSYALFFVGMYYAFSDIRYELPEFLEGAAAAFEKLFIKGTLPSAIFIVVMYAGALNPKKYFAQRLMQVRMELSIIASSLISLHILVNLISFAKRPTADPLELTLLISASAAFLLLIPLWTTSYITIRRRISPDKWKRIQKLAYPLYFLIFLHGAVLHAFLTHSALDLFSYIAIFGIYLALRLNKLNKYRKEIL